MRILCVFGKHAYGDPARGAGYEHANFLPALRELGHEVEVFESFDRRAYGDFAELNRAFVAKVAQWRPDVVLSVLMHYELWSETLALVRRLGTAVLNWGTDDSWKYAQFTRYLARNVDVYATTSHEALAAARAEGLDNVILTQWAASDAGLAEPLAASECRYPVSFIGAAYGRRRRWIEGLRQHGIEVACFGHGWPAGAVDTARLREITRASVVSLNFSEASVHGRQLKARVFEVPGCGGMLLTEQTSHLEEYLAPGKEVETFASPEDLVTKIHALLQDTARRDAIARAGHARVRSEHLYSRRFQPLLDAARERVRRRSAEERDVQGAGAGESVSGNRVPDEEIAALAAAHATGPLHKFLRAVLVAPCRVLFGPRRGPRAARRLLYEISWRFAGERTYSARGLPGRLFYAES